MKLPESVIIQLLENSLSRYLGEDGKKDFKENPVKYLVSFLLVVEKRMKEDWISAMLHSTVQKAVYNRYLEEAQKLLEGKEKKTPQEQTASKM